MGKYLIYVGSDGVVKAREATADKPFEYHKKMAVDNGFTVLQPDRPITANTAGEAILKQKKASDLRGEAKPLIDQANAIDKQSKPATENTDIGDSFKTMIMPSTMKIARGEAPVLDKPISQGVPAVLNMLGEVAATPLRNAYDLTRNIPAGLSTKFPFVNPLKYGQAVYENMQQAPNFEDNMARAIASDPTNLLPVPTIKGAEIFGNVGNKLAKKLPEWESGIKKFGKNIVTNWAPKLTGKAVEGGIAGAEMGGLSNLLQQGREGQDFNIGDMGEGALWGAGFGGVLSPTLYGAGNIVKSRGKGFVEGSIKSLPSIQAMSANPPDVENLLNLHGENIIPYFGGIESLVESVGKKTQALNTSNKDIVPKLAKNVNVNVEAALNKYKSSLLETFNAGKISPKEYAKALQVADETINNIALQKGMKTLSNTSNDDMISRYLDAKKQNIPFVETTQDKTKNLLPAKNVNDLDDIVKYLNESRVNASAIPFDIAYQARQNMDNAARWDKTFDPKRDVELEQINKDMRGYLQNQMFPDLGKDITPEEYVNKLINKKQKKYHVLGLPEDERVTKVVSSFIDDTFKNPDLSNLTTQEKLKIVSNKLTKDATLEAEKMKEVSPEMVKFIENQRDYGKLLPWIEPLDRSLARSTNSSPLGMIEAIMLSSALSSPTAGGGLANLALAGFAKGQRSPGFGSAIYDIGKSMRGEKGGLVPSDKQRKIKGLGFKTKSPVGLQNLLIKSTAYNKKDEEN